MGVVGRMAQGVYSVATPFHPFGGAIDIIVVEQPDGSYRSTPWYVRFGKFLGVLKGAEKVVTITVNGVDASFHMLLDNSGQAYFMRELVPGSEDTGTGSEEEAINEPEPPVRSKSDGELYIGTSDRPGSPELNVEHQDKQTGEGFDSYDYGLLEEAEDLAKQANGGNSEMVLVIVDGHVLTAPISSTENMEDVQLSGLQFHLGPEQSSSGDFSRSALKELGEAPIEKDKSHDILVDEDKAFHVSGHQSQALEELGEVPIEKDELRDILVDEDEALHVSVNENAACVVSTNEDEAQGVSGSGNNDEGYQPLTNEDESHDISGNNDEVYQPLPNEDEAHDVSENNDNVSENNDEGFQPLTNEDEACDVPLLDNDKACKAPANVDKVCDVSNEDIELEDVGASFGKYDTFKSCLDLTSQIDGGDSGNEPFSPEFDRRRDSELSLSNRSVVEIDRGEDESNTANCDRNDPLQYLQQEVDTLAVTSDDNKTENEDSSAHYGKESDLSCEGGSHERSKDITSSEVEADKSDGLQSSPVNSAKDKLGSIPENSTAEEELNKEEHPQLQKGLGLRFLFVGIC